MANMFKANETLNMALGMSVELGNFSLVQKLLKAGANINSNYNDQTLLHTAIAIREDADFDDSLKKILLKYAGADLNVKNSEGETLLHVAVKSNDSACLEFLLESNGHLYAKNKRGQSILFYAVWYEEWGNQILHLLLKRGLYYINEQDLQGNSILHGLHPGLPEETANCECLYWCFLYGAKINLYNKDNKYPYVGCTCDDKLKCKVLIFLANIRILNNTNEDTYVDSYKNLYPHLEHLNNVLEIVRPQALAELGRLKLLKAGDICLYDFLYMNRTKLATASRQKVLKAKLRDLKTFPIFMDFLQLNPNQGKKRAFLMEKCKQRFWLIDGTIAELCIIKILYFLNFEDLINFCHIKM